MQTLEKEIKVLEKNLPDALEKAQTAQEIEAVRIQFLGKKGSISALMLRMKDLSPDEKRTLAPLIMSCKKNSEKLIKKAKYDLLEKHIRAEENKKKHFDVTAYTPNKLQGHMHPLSSFTQEVESIFLSMGYSLFDGPEVETDEYNFSALNIPDEHPARDMYDTLWLQEKNYLLRTHTSTVQVHAMKNHKPPIAGIATGRVFRHEAVDASHDFMFMQCEGIVIDKGINLSHLFATTQDFLQALFNTKKLDIRIRPGFFPFVEPGVEIDMRCPFCKKGCSVCKKTTWIEVFPGGMIHPNVLLSASLDPNVYSGFAFGFGLTRLAMLKYGVDDIRLFHCGKPSFLYQF